MPETYEIIAERLRKKIKVDDRVRISWTGHPSEHGTVIHTPSGAGDLWQVEFDDGRVAAINPYGPRFEGFWKMKPVDEQDDEEKHQDYLAEQEQARRPL